MNLPLRAPALAATLLIACAAAQAQQDVKNIVKVGVTRYDTNAKTNGISGIGVPAGADIETTDATTAIFVYERLINPNLGVELVLGIPPRIKANAKGSVAFLGDDVLSAKNVAPTLLVNWHFGQPGDTWRPYVGAGINYTKFANVKSKLADDVEMGDSVGLAVQAGIDYKLSPQWSLFGSVARVDVKSKVVAAGATVLTTKVDFRPIVYSFGVAYSF